MCAQLDLEVICKGSKKEGRPFNLSEFWDSLLKNLSKKTLMFEHYNLVDLMEWGVVIF